MLAAAVLLLAGCGGGTTDTARCRSFQKFSYLTSRMHETNLLVGNARVSDPEANAQTQALTLSNEFRSASYSYGSLAEMASEERGDYLPWRTLERVLTLQADWTDDLATVLYDNPGADVKSTKRRNNALDRLIERAETEQEPLIDEMLRRATKAFRAEGFEQRGNGGFVVRC